MSEPLGFTGSIAELPDKLEGDIQLSIPLKYRRGSLRENEPKSIESAIRNLKGIASRTGRFDWSNQRVLDYGCGVKITQALIQYGVPVKNYVGMDVYEGLIHCLKDLVQKPNFEYYHVPFHNEMYNRKGIPLTAESNLPGNLSEYDLIILQSVFTHFAPDDFLALLKVLRRYAASDCRLLFTCFINNNMEQDFLDSVPERPLLKAYYKEGFIQSMLKESHWNPISLHEPSFAMQHHFVCQPA